MTWKIIALSWLLVLSNGEEPLAAPSVKDHGLPVRGFPFSLSCIAVVLPFHVRVDQLTFTWFKDDLELEGQSAVTLSFDRVMRSNEGSYTCRVSLGSTLSTSAQSRPFSLDVMVHPNVTIEPTTPNSEIKAVLGKIKAVLGSSVTLTCVVREAYPRVLDTGYSWSYRLLVTDEWKSLSQGGKSLTLTNVTREARGHYKCQARNDAGVEGQIPPGEASVSMEVLYMESITVTSTGLEFNEGDHVALTCRVESNPPARLAWLVDGQEVRHVTHNTDHYVLEKVACSDSKTYTCHAFNAALPGSNKTASTALNVHCTNTDSHQLTSTTPAQRSANAEVSALFRMLITGGDSIFIEHPHGHTVLTVKPTCNYSVPEKRITDVICDSASKLLVFRLSSVTEEDEGEYTCKEEHSGRLVSDCSQRLVLRGRSDCIPDNAGLIIAAILAAILAVIVIVLLLLHKTDCLRRIIPRQREVESENAATMNFDARQYPDETVERHPLRAENTIG